MLTLPTKREAYASITSTLCPACGQKKKSYMTLCRGDYYKLPQPMRKALYAKIGHGYEQALFEALAFLGVEFITLPQKEDERRPAPASNGQ